MTNRPILLVEDNPDDVELTLRAFEINKIANQIIVARDGVEALDWLFATGPRAGQSPLNPAVVLLDLKLPRVDGLEVLRRLSDNERTRQLRVVVLTTSKEQQDIINSYHFGAASYICKPVSFDEFVKAAGQLGLYWLLMNELPVSPGDGDR
jgi:two-component system response regulator